MEDGGEDMLKINQKSTKVRNGLFFKKFTFPNLRKRYEEYKKFKERRKEMKRLEKGMDKKIAEGGINYMFNGNKIIGEKIYGY